MHAVIAKYPDIVIVPAAYALRQAGIENFLLAYRYACSLALHVGLARQRALPA